MDLIKIKPEIHGIDIEDKFKPVQQCLVLKANDLNPLTNILSAFKKLAQIPEYDQIQVHIDDLNGRSVSPRLDKSQFQAAEILYMRKIVIDGFSPPLDDSCYTKLNGQISSKMSEIFSKEKW